MPADLLCLNAIHSAESESHTNLIGGVVHVSKKGRKRSLPRATLRHELGGDP